jgi:hypothetical protein
MSAPATPRSTANGASHTLEERVLEQLRRDLATPVDLAIARKPEEHCYHMQTQFIHIGFDGRRTGVETYLVRLACVAAALVGKHLDEYTCREFGLQLGDAPAVTLPALRHFGYRFDYMSGVAGNGPLFGVPQEPFKGLTDSAGNPLSPDIAYAAYNNFIDFHALTDVFSRPLPYIKGVEQLKQIGDRIVHPGAFSEAPVSLDGVVRPGSVFRNGELTLDLKGISLVDDRPCALVNYDSGESTLRMAFIRGDLEDLTMVGGSEYKGDIYIDLESGWVRKVTLDESVVTQTSTASRPDKVPGYTARHILLRLVSREDFEKPIALLH